MAQFLNQVTDRCNLFLGYKKEDRSTDYELEKKGDISLKNSD